MIINCSVAVRITDVFKIPSTWWYLLHVKLVRSHLPVLVDQGQSCLPRPPSWEHVTMPKDIFDLSPLGVRGVTGMWWVEAKEAAKHTPCTGQPTQQRIILPHVSVVLR